MLVSMHHDVLLLTLDSLFTLSAQTVEPTPMRLAVEVGVREAVVIEALHHLESRGLVDAGRVRLTMRGLATAAALHASLERTAATTLRAA